MFIAFFFFIPRPFCDFRLPLLPKSSSGLIPVAKTPSFLQFLNTQRETGGLQLIYRIIVHGKVQFDKDSVEITISFPIHHLPIWVRPKPVDSAPKTCVEILFCLTLERLPRLREPRSF